MIRPIRSSSSRFHRSLASARSRSAAAHCPRFASNSSPTNSQALGSASRMCAPRSRRPTPTAPKATSIRAISATKSFPMIRRARPRNYRDLVIAYRNGAVVLLHDVADVEDSNENIRNAGLFNGTPTVGVVIFPLPGANIIKTVAQIKKVLPSIKATLPPSIAVQIASDRSQSVTAAVKDTERTLFLAVLLVIGVVFVFLQSPRATLIPAAVLPLSILGSFGPMYLLGYSIDNLSLMALTIATGFVVDDAVVVLENVVRKIELGMDVREAALRGSAEVSFTVISMSLSLIAVFIPILLMPGIVGLLFHEFAMTLSIAILLSLLISLTVTPTMCAYLLARGETLRSRARWARWAEALFE